MGGFQRGECEGLCEIDVNYKLGLPSTSARIKSCGLAAADF